MKRLIVLAAIALFVLFHSNCKTEDKVQSKKDKLWRKHSEWAGSPENPDAKPYDYFYTSSAGWSSSMAVRAKSGSMMHLTCIQSATRSIEQNFFRFQLIGFGVCGNHTCAIEAACECSPKGNKTSSQLAAEWQKRFPLQILDCRPTAKIDSSATIYSEWAECECMAYVKIPGGRETLLKEFF